MTSHTDEDYINTDPFFPDETEVVCRTVTIKKARKDHLCYGLTPDTHNKHKISKGDKYRDETGMVDGKWGGYKMCLSCMDKFIAGDF